MPLRPNARCIKRRSPGSRRPWPRLVNTAKNPVDADGQLLQGPGPDANVVESLQAENLRLRAAWQELAERTSSRRSFPIVGSEADRDPE